MAAVRTWPTTAAAAAAAFAGGGGAEESAACRYGPWRAIKLRREKWNIREERKRG